MYEYMSNFTSSLQLNSAASGEVNDNAVQTIIKQFK